MNDQDVVAASLIAQPSLLVLLAACLVRCCLPQGYATKIVCFYSATEQTDLSEDSVKLQPTKEVSRAPKAE